MISYFLYPTFLYARPLKSICGHLIAVDGVNGPPHQAASGEHHLREHAPSPGTFPSAGGKVGESESTISENMLFDQTKYH